VPIDGANVGLNDGEIAEAVPNRNSDLGRHPINLTTLHNPQGHFARFSLPLLTDRDGRPIPASWDARQVAAY
jgi:hypothetical protein